MKKLVDKFTELLGKSLYPLMVETSPAQSPLFSNPLNFFLGKTVLVEAEDHTVSGKLVHCEMGDKRDYRPTVLILQDSGKVIVRKWSSIKEL